MLLVVVVSCVIYQATLLGMTCINNLHSVECMPLHNHTSEDYDTRSDSATDVLIWLAIAEQRKHRQLAKDV
jgi:hypothetical protein